MGMPAIENRRWTAAEIRAMPFDGNQYEVVSGEGRPEILTKGFEWLAPGAEHPVRIDLAALFAEAALGEE
jgi:hypothetical protein